jgi:hypothetical protein
VESPLRGDTHGGFGRAGWGDDPLGTAPQLDSHHDRVGRAGIDSQEDLKGKALAALRRLQKLPHVVRGFFRDPNLRYITQ